MSYHFLSSPISFLLPDYFSHTFFCLYPFLTLFPTYPSFLLTPLSYLPLFPTYPSFLLTHLSFLPLFPPHPSFLLTPLSSLPLFPTYPSFLLFLLTLLSFFNPDRMGVDIPDSARIVLFQEDKFKNYYNELHWALSEYDKVVGKVIPVTAMVLRPHFRYDILILIVVL